MPDRYVPRPYGLERDNIAMVIDDKSTGEVVMVVGSKRQKERVLRALNALGNDDPIRQGKAVP